MIKAILIDINGVIIQQDREAICERIEEQYHLERGVFWKQFHDTPRWKQFTRGAIPATLFWKELAEQLDRKISPEYIMNHFFAKRYLNTSLLRFLKKCKKRLLTYSNGPKTFKEYYQRLGLDKVFDLIITSGETGVRKPDENAYRILVEKSRLKPEEIACIDNKEENLRTAEGMGFTVVLFTSTKELKKELERLSAP